MISTNYVVAIKRKGRVAQFYFGSDWYESADRVFEEVKADPGINESVSLWSRAEWNGPRRTPKRVHTFNQ